MEQHDRTITLTCPPASTGTVLGGFSVHCYCQLDREAGYSTLGCNYAFLRCSRVSSESEPDQLQNKSCWEMLPPDHTHTHTQQLHSYNERNGSTCSPFRALTALYGELQHRNIRSESKTIKYRPILHTINVLFSMQEWIIKTMTKVH